LSGVHAEVAGGGDGILVGTEEDECGTRTTPLAATISINHWEEEISQFALCRMRWDRTVKLDPVSTKRRAIMGEATPSPTAARTKSSPLRRSNG
jgi:hypothetical protein